MMIVLSVRGVVSDLGEISACGCVCVCPCFASKSHRVVLSGPLDDGTPLAVGLLLHPVWPGRRRSVNIYNSPGNGVLWGMVARGSVGSVVGSFVVTSDLWLCLGNDGTRSGIVVVRGVDDIYILVEGLVILTAKTPSER